MRVEPVALKIAGVAAALLVAAAASQAQEREVFVLLREPPAARSHDLRARRAVLERQQSKVLEALSQRGVTVQQRLHLVSAFSARVSEQGMAALRAHPEVLRVDPMRYGSGALDRSVPQIRADAAHRRDDKGQGVSVAVLDTGVQPQHPDISGRVIAEQCFCSGGCCPNGLSEQAGAGSAFTTFVHGIHVAGIIASQGHAAPLGVAPRANLVAVKVLNDENRGSLVDWLRGLEWVLEQRPDVQVVNMSLVSDAVFPGFCDSADSFNTAFGQTIEQLRVRGALTFVSSGNTGDLEMMTSPACVQSAVAVGAVERDDRVSDYTSRSSALDLLAPGTDILSDAPNGGTERLTGTSMAAPHAAGAAALLYAWHPDLSPDAIETILKRRGKPVHDSLTDLTVARVDALAALTAVMPRSQPFVGGGSGRTDCLLEWHVVGAPQIQLSPYLHITCRDGDPICDRDNVAGQCSVGVSLCLNEPDVRLPRCTTATPLRDFSVRQPRLTAADFYERENAAVLLGALPPFPVNGVDVCTGGFDVRVPAGGRQRIRMSVSSSDHRRDADRVVLDCTR